MVIVWPSHVMFQTWRWKNLEVLIKLEILQFFPDEFASPYDVDGWNPVNSPVEIGSLNPIIEKGFKNIQTVVQDVSYKTIGNKDNQMIILIGSRLSYLWTVRISGPTVGCSQVRVSLRRRRNLFLGGKLWCWKMFDVLLWKVVYERNHEAGERLSHYLHCVPNLGFVAVGQFIRQTNWNGENTANIEYFEESARRSWKNGLVPLKTNEYPPEIMIGRRSTFLLQKASF